tara:strand:+ start:355 stop:2268 length:1914 start_codon:yes stop_codon:yes gene_type:complete
MTAQKTILQNAYETTLALAIGADATEVSVQVNAAPVGTPTTSVPMYLVIDPDSDSTREYVRVTARSGVSLTVVRNIDSDSGGLNAHAVGAKVRMVAMKQHFDDLNERVDKIINDDGSSLNTATGVVKDEDNMASNSATHLATQQSIKAYVDAQVDTKDTLAELDDVTITSVGDNEVLAYDNSSSKFINQTASEASLATSAQGALADTAVQPASSDTLTNKSIDVDNNTVTNIEVDNLKSGVLDTDISSVAGTDTTIPSAKAVKTYVDAQVDTKDTLAELDDVTITSVGDNDIIAYDNSSSKYINQTASEAGLATSAQGALADSATQPSDNISTLTNDSGFITASTTNTLTNKTIDADGTGNSITNIEDANIKSAAAIDASKIADGSVSNAEFQRLDGVTSDIQTQLDAKGDVTASSTTTFTNKTIDADGTGNSITNIEDANIKSAAAIDAAKIADGSVSNAEFQRLDGVTSDIQTQLDAKGVGDITAVNTAADSGLAGGAASGDASLTVDPSNLTDGSGITVDTSNDLMILEDVTDGTVYKVNPSQFSSGSAGALTDGDSDFTLSDGVANGIHYELDNTDMADWNQGGVALTAAGGMFRHNQTQSATFTVAATEGTVLAGPITITGTVTNAGTMVIL